MDEAEVTENVSADPPSRRRRFWEKHRDLIAFVGVVATIGAFLLAVWAFTRDGGDVIVGDSVEPRRLPEPENVVEQVAQRPFWVRPPQVFESAKDALDFDAPGPDYSAAGGPVILDARDLADDAVTWEGEAIYVVGRVVRERSVEDLFDLNTEYQLAPVRGTTMYVGESYHFSLELPVPSPAEGDVIYASGKLAAVGEARELGGRPVPAVYFLAGYVGIYEPGKSKIDSRALEKALAAIAQRR